MTLACPVKECSRSTKPGNLMCFQHWRRVSHINQRAVWDAWNWLQRIQTRAQAQASAGRPVCSLVDELSEARGAHDKAKAAAIEEVELKEGRK